MAIPNTEPVGSVAALKSDELLRIIHGAEASQKAALGGVAETKPSRWVIPETLEPWPPHTPTTPYPPATGVTSVHWNPPPKRDTSIDLALSVIRRVINDTVKSLLDEQDRRELELALAVIEGKK